MAFFLPVEQGIYGERRVYELDIVEWDPEESVDRLRRYLNYNAVRSRQAIEATRKDYQDVAKKREIQSTLPAAWQKLVTEADELLVE